MRITGMLGLERIAEKARNTGITFARHERGNGIGLLANIHLAAAVAPAPFIEYPFDPPEWTVERRDFILAGPVVAVQGWTVLSERPGLGFELDDAHLEATRIQGTIPRTGSRHHRQEH